MPPDSRTVEDEGVLFTNFQLVKNGELREQAARDILGSGRWPARNPDQNIADMRAQIAANEKGVQELLRMCDHFGLDVVRAYMGHVQDNAEEAVRRVISVLKNGRYEYPLDNGAVIKVEVRVDNAARSAVVDFTGTSPQLDNNFNAPGAIAVAAVLYVFRTLVNDDIPLNDGCLVPLSIVLPEGSMLRPNSPASVVAGNVETSMCIVNALYGALGVLASSQGTMNNFTLGNARHQYYETISGGTGAGPVRIDAAGPRDEGFAGTSVVQAHMTNSRLTDPEVLEFRFPGTPGVVRDPSRLGRRRALSGRRRRRAPHALPGRHDGRDPVEQPLHAPFGLSGGQPGAMGRNYVERADGTVQPLGPAGQRPAASGRCVRGGNAGRRRLRRAVGAGRPAPLAGSVRLPASGAFSFRIVHHVQRDLRARLAVVHAQRDFAVADLEHGGGQRVLAIGVMPVRAQDRQCASVSCSAASSSAPPVAGDQLSTMPSMRCWRARDESVTTCGRPAVSAWIMWLAWP